MKHRMLVTDDDVCLLEMYRCIFASVRDLTVDYAESPAACKSCVGAQTYDVALLDISLNDPSEDGFALLQLIRARSPDTDVLMMSSMDSGDTVARCLSLGAKTFTSKNRNFPAAIRAQVRHVLARRRASVAVEPERLAH